MRARFTDLLDYVIAGGQANVINYVRERLYDDKPLSGDQRRDLANMLDAALHYLDPVEPRMADSDA